MEKALNNESDFYSFIAVKKEEVIGYLNFEIQGKEEIDAYLNIPRKNYPSILKDAEKAGAIKTGSVKKKYQHRGVGTKLNKRVLHRLQKEGIHLVYTIGWIKEEEANISSIMDKMGFKKVREIDDYWKKESVLENYACNSCGEPPCTCSASIFVKSL